MHLGQVPSDVKRKFPSLHLVGVNIPINPHGRLVGVFACGKVSDGQGQNVSSLHRLANRLNSGKLGMGHRDFFHQVPEPLRAVIAVPSDFNFWSMRRAYGSKVIFLLRICFKRA